MVRDVEYVGALSEVPLDRLNHHSVCWGRAALQGAGVLVRRLNVEATKELRGIDPGGVLLPA
jgi:hypothetical protein